MTGKDASLSLCRPVVAMLASSAWHALKKPHLCAHAMLGQLTKRNWLTALCCESIKTTTVNFVLVTDAG